MPKQAIGLPDPEEYGSTESLTPGTVVPLFAQLHAAERAGTHTDVRLGGVKDKLMSWAVRKGMPKPGEKHLAIQQPLHEESYGPWEGEIPEGYGKGKVTSTLRGRALITGATKDSVSFTTAHTRYPERFRLQKTPQGWLLINVTPKDPRDYGKIHYKRIPAEDVEKLFTPENLISAKIDGSATWYEVLGDKIEALSYRTSKVTGRPILHTERIGSPRIQKQAASFTSMQRKGYYPKADPQAAAYLDAVVKRLEENPDLPADWVPHSVEFMARNEVAKTKLTPKQIEDMGFRPSLIAVPELGQAKWTTWRHPRSTVHIHDYGPDWMLHKDKFPSLSMLLTRLMEDRKAKRKTTPVGPRILGGALGQGARHVWEEGVPGYIGWANRMITGAPGFSSRVEERKNLLEAGQLGNVPPESTWNLGKAVPRIGLLLGGSAALGSLIGGLPKKPIEGLAPTSMGIPIANRRAVQTAVGASAGLGAGLGATAGILAMPGLSSLMIKLKMSPALKSYSYLSVLSSLIAAGYYGGRAVGRRLFTTPGQRQKIMKFKPTSGEEVGWADVPFVQMKKLRKRIEEIKNQRLPMKKTASAPTVLRGEMYGVRDDKAIPSAELGGLLNASVGKSLQEQERRKVVLRHALFDIIKYRGKDVQGLPYERRRELLQKAMKGFPSQFHVVEDTAVPEEQRRLWEQVTSGKHRLTEEGIVAQPLAGGKPSKVKTYPEADVYIREIFPGTGKYERAAGGFHYSLTPRGPIVGKVGAGISDEDRFDMVQNPESWIGRTAKIRAQEQFESGAYRAPAFLARHEDYPHQKAANSTLQNAAVRRVVGGFLFLDKLAAEYSTVMAPIPDDVAQRVRALAAKIPDEDLAADGRENFVHTTVKYGLHTRNPVEALDRFKTEGPIEAKITRLSLFEGPKYDVLKFGVLSPKLSEWHRKLESLPNADSHPVYFPHITVAYLKKGTGQKYLGKTDVDGTRVVLDRLHFSTPGQGHVRTRLVAAPQL